MHRLAVPCRVSSCCVKEVGSERSSQLLVDPATEETVRSDICIEEGGGGRRLSVGGRERLSGMTCFILVYLKSRSQMFLLRAAVRAASIFPECAVSSLVDAVMFRMGMKAIVAFTVFDKGWKHRKFTAGNPDSHFLTPPPNPPTQFHIDSLALLQSAQNSSRKEKLQVLDNHVHSRSLVQFLTVD